MSKFKPGDRVAVYGQSTDAPGYYRRGDKATVDFITAEDEIGVTFDDGTEHAVHPKQCRKLKSTKCYACKRPIK